MKTSSSICVAVVGIVLVAAAPAKASVVSDTFTVFDPTGAVAASATDGGIESSCVGFACIVTIPGIAPNVPLETTPTLVLEPDGTPSDLFGVYCAGQSPNGAPTDCALAFVSDPLPNGLNFQGTLGPVSESATGGSFDATSYLDASLQDAGWHATFVSDGDPSTDNDVPEPITLSLFGAGLAGALAMRRRKTKAA